MVDPFYVAWRKMVRLIWGLPYTTHCNLLPYINDSLPINVALEKRSLKLLWTNLNSSNNVVKLTNLSSIKCERSVIGDNYRYFSYKYDIKPHQWFDSFCKVKYHIDRYVILHVNHPQNAFIIKELCLLRDTNGPFVLTFTEIVQLIEYLCTI